MREAPMVETVGVYVEDRNPLEAATSGVAWPAIIGGAFAAAVLSLILLALGSGFGLASVSPWSNSGASATTFTVMTAIWLIVVQWLASGPGLFNANDHVIGVGTASAKKTIPLEGFV